ncbi:Zinc finger C2H2-type [Trinorchestia longiramus]|nr:Zinc finger C2H2-type [Trinorchestia longiramus]
MENEGENTVKGNQKRKKHELTNKERTEVLQALLERSKDRLLERGAINQVARTFGIGRNTVGRIWSRALESSSDVWCQPMDVSNRKYLTGRKKKDYQSQLEEFASISLRERCTLRSAAAACGIPKTTLIARLKDDCLTQASTTAPRVAAVEDEEEQAKHHTRVTADRSTDLWSTCGDGEHLVPPGQHPDEAVNASDCSGNSESSVNFLRAVEDDALDPCSLIDPLFNVATVYIKEEIEDDAVSSFVKSESMSGFDKASTSSALVSPAAGGAAALLREAEASADGTTTVKNSNFDATQLLLLGTHEAPQALAPLATYSSTMGKRIFKEGILQWSEDGNICEMVKRISKAKNPEPKIHQCPQCGFTFARKRCLERHMMAKHSDIRPYRCSLCDYSSAFKSCLKKHTLVKHSGIKPFQCTHCDYSTPYRKDLDRHIMVRHSTFRPFQCSLCDFSCADISNLKRHTRVKHFGVSPYHCTQCDYSSADKSNLRRHIKAKHSDDKPFQCTLSSARHTLSSVGDVLSRHDLRSSRSSVLCLSNSVHQIHTFVRDITLTPYTPTSYLGISGGDVFFRCKNFMTLLIQSPTMFPSTPSSSNPDFGALPYNKPHPPTVFQYCDLLSLLSQQI